MRSKCGGPIGEKSSFHRSFNGAWMKNPTVSYSVTRILLGGGVSVSDMFRI